MQNLFSSTSFSPTIQAYKWLLFYCCSFVVLIVTIVSVSVVVVVNVTIVTVLLFL